MPNVELAIGIGRAVMKNEGRSAFTLFTHLPIQVHFGPGFESLRLSLRQIGLHRKICLRQIQRGFVITHTLSVFSKPSSCIGLVRGDARFECIQRRKLLLIAQLVSKPHRQPLTIQIRRAR